MNTKQFLEDLCDVINNNSEYMTIEKFREKYKDFKTYAQERNTSLLSRGLECLDGMLVEAFTTTLM